MDEAIYQGVFEKTFKNSVAARESGYCPFTYSMFESHFVNPLKKISLSNPRLKAVLSTYLSKISPQSLTATMNGIWKSGPGPSLGSKSGPGTSIWSVPGAPQCEAEVSASVNG